MPTLFEIQRYRGPLGLPLHANGKEESAIWFLPYTASVWREFKEKRRRRLQKWPIACRDCGEYFKPAEHLGRVRCPACRERRRNEKS